MKNKILAKPVPFLLLPTVFIDKKNNRAAYKFVFELGLDKLVQCPIFIGLQIMSCKRNRDDSSLDRRQGIREEGGEASREVTREHYSAGEKYESCCLVFKEPTVQRGARDVNS